MSLEQSKRKWRGRGQRPVKAVGAANGAGRKRTALPAKTARARHRADLEAFDTRTLSKMDNKALAAWQSQFKPDEAQWLLAEDERQKRLRRPDRMIALAAFIIALLSFILNNWHPHH
jgi:hypothetical protein